jgi:hypothetical protein
LQPSDLGLSLRHRDTKSFSQLAKYPKKKVAYKHTLILAPDGYPRANISLNFSQPSGKVVIESPSLLATSLAALADSLAAHCKRQYAFNMRSGASLKALEALSSAPYL